MIAIPNINKPKSCCECPIAKSYFDCLMEKKYICPIGHTDDCPLIEIPKPHGRLIDADLLKDTIRDSVPAYGIGVKIPTYGDMDIMDKISIMPTILEAET